MFLGRLVGWVKSFQPIVLVPLVLLAIGWTVATARRERVRSESFGTISAALLLPFLGVNLGVGIFRAIINSAIGAVIVLVLLAMIRRA